MGVFNKGGKEEKNAAENKETKASAVEEAAKDFFKAIIKQGKEGLVCDKN